MAHVAGDHRNGRWLARWRDPSGRQRKKSFPRRIDAQRWLDQMRAEMHRGQYIDPAAGKLRVGDLATSWAQGLAHLKPSTRERYQGVVRRHIVPAWGNWSLAAVSHSDINAWIARLSDSDLRPGTVRQIHRVFSLVMDAAVNDGRIGRNPASGVKLPRQVRGEPTFLTAAQVARLVEAAGDDWLPVCVLAFTGLRFGELAAIRVRRIDLTRRRISIAENLTEVAGHFAWSTPKTHQTRSVPFPPSLVEPLTAAVDGKKPDELLFTSHQGEPLRLTNWRHRVFDPAVRRAGLVGVTPHDLRHTAASLAIASGANVKAVQRMLGHASAAMTLDVYAGLFADDLDAVADALDRYVPHPPASPDDSPGGVSVTSRANEPINGETRGVENSQREHIEALWKEHGGRTFPQALEGGVTVEGIDAVMLDADVAGQVSGCLGASRRLSEAEANDLRARSREALRLSEALSDPLEVDYFRVLHQLAEAVLAACATNVPRARS